MHERERERERERDDDDDDDVPFELAKDDDLLWCDPLEELSDRGHVIGEEPLRVGVLNLDGNNITTVLEHRTMHLGWIGMADINPSHIGKYCMRCTGMRER